MTPEDIAHSWIGKFHYKKETPNQPGLRGPQIGALHALLAHQEEEGGRCIVVMPTGTGKTETMLAFMVANQCKRIMVVVPSDALRNQLYEKFTTLGKLKELGVVDNNTRLPNVKKVDKTFSDKEWGKVITENNVIVITMALATKIDKVIAGELHNQIDYLFVDEAHHSQAQTWNDFISGFDDHKIVMFTATPFRNDGKRLKGRFIFTYTLRQAKKDGYFSDIEFIPIYAYSQEEGDRDIAKTAIKRLRDDIAAGYDHILMARCNTKERALQIYKLYEKEKDLSPTLIYNGVGNESSKINEIKQGLHRIIVCVNMLGEGFDLPQLKIAALHDARQSLAITLQFIGRFTRTSGRDLGKASFIANIEDKDMIADLSQLYQEDADWNILLPRISDKAIGGENIAKHIKDEFVGDLIQHIDMGEITPASSTVIYEVECSITNFKNWSKGISSLNNYSTVYTACAQDTFVAVMNRQSQVEWSKARDFYNTTWGIIVIYYNAVTKRVFYNSSVGFDSDKIIKNIFGPTFKLIKGECIFRVLKSLKRLLFYNVGTKVPGGTNVSYRSFSGSSVEDGLGEMDQKILARNNFFGSGFKGGELTSIGCSVKGKIWSRLRINLEEFKNWCNWVNSYVSDNSIRIDDIFAEMMVRKEIHDFPSNVLPLSVDWHEEVYSRNCFFISSPDKIPLEYISLTVDPVVSESHNIILHLTFNDKAYNISYILDDNGSHYSCHQDLIISDGNNDMTVGDFFAKYPPIIIYADESELQGNWYIHPKTIEKIAINDDKVIGMDWGNVNLKNESMGRERKIDSIQYYFWKAIENKHIIVFNDDGSGEIADLIGIDEKEKEIHVHLYHLKYARSGKVNKQIENIYEVCGQAIKSAKWKHLQRNFNFFHRLLYRNELWAKDGYSRILNGNIKDLQKLERISKYSKKLKLDISIVQPGISKSKMTDEMKLVFGATEHYLFNSANASFTIYCSK